MARASMRGGSRWHERHAGHRNRRQVPAWHIASRTRRAAAVRAVREHFVSETIRILLVDDHPMVRERLCARLSSVPRFAVVGEAGEPDEALRRLPDTRPDVALLDVGLKGGTG